LEAEGAVLNAISLISSEEVLGMSGVMGRFAMCAISSLNPASNAQRLCFST